MTQKIIRNYATFMLLEGIALSFFFGTYTLFLFDKGLNLFEINFINFSFMTANFLLEIPTGAIADLIGRKKSVVIGLAIYSFSFFIYFLSDSFWQFLLAEIIGALAFTCISGALEAMVVDSLNHHKYEGKLEKVFRRGEIKQLGVIIGVITGSFIGQINLAWPWLLSSIFFMILAVVTIFIFREDYFVKPEKTKFSFTPIKKIIYDSFRYGLKNRNLMSMIIFSAIIAFIIQAVNMYWPIVFQQDFSVPTKFMGVIFALIVIFSYGGAQLSDFWQRKIGCHKNAIFFSQIITVLGIFFCVFSFKLPIFLVFFLVHEFGRGLVSPLKRAYVNNHIQDKNRSTILSFESMVVKGGAALGLLFGGLIANSFSIMTSWLFSSIILLMTIFIFWFNNREKK